MSPQRHSLADATRSVLKDKDSDPIKVVRSVQATLSRIKKVNDAEKHAYEDLVQSNIILAKCCTDLYERVGKLEQEVRALKSLTVE